MAEVASSSRKVLSRRVVLTMFGSLGDPHPYIAIGLELRERGHEVTLATSDIYRQAVEAEGLTFARIRPSFADFADVPDLAKRILDARSGLEFIIRRLVMPHLREMYDDLLSVCHGADLLVSHPLVFPAPIIAEQLRSCGLEWASVSLSPTGFLSADDPPVLTPTPWLPHLRHGSARRRISIRGWRSS